MVSEEKVRIMTELARYEKAYKDKDFHIDRYREEDYIRLETIKMSISLTAAFLGIILLIGASQMDRVIMTLRKGQMTVVLLGVLAVYLILFFVYRSITKKRAIREYQDVEVRIRMYDRHLEELLRLYEEKEKEDDSPTITSEEKADGQSIDI
nr:hypothetical protein [uncultured Anaerostipes sp.]